MTRRSRLATLLGGFVFVSIQLAIGLGLEFGPPQLCDPEYGYRLRVLQRRIAAEPHRPLLLIIGSSRSCIGMVPAHLMSAAPQSDRSPLCFNFALTGAGPVLELLTLRRLLCEGIRPRWLALEIHPALLHHDPCWAMTSWISVNRIYRSDLSTLVPFADDPESLVSQWSAARKWPGYTFRRELLNGMAPALLHPAQRSDGNRLVDLTGMMPYTRDTATADERNQGLRQVRQDYSKLQCGFHIAERSERAVREILNLCREHSIEVLLYLMPEGQDFRDLYPPSASATVHCFLARLQGEYGLTVADARNWVSENGFFDSHHLFRPAAASFSRRFGALVLRPWIQELGRVPDSAAHQPETQAPARPLLRAGFQERAGQ